MQNSYENPPSGQSSREPSAGGVVAETVRPQTSDTLQQTQDAAAQVARQAQQQATSALDSQKDRAAQSLTVMGDALRQSGRQLREQDAGPLSRLPDKVADRLDTVSATLSSKSTDELLRDLESLARRNTAIFLGAAFTLGVLAARFLKSSAPASDAPQGSYRDYAGYGASGARYAYRSRAGDLTGRPDPSMGASRRESGDGA
jgi:hypothetical protein